MYVNLLFYLNRWEAIRRYDSLVSSSEQMLLRLLRSRVTKILGPTVRSQVIGCNKTTINTDLRVIYRLNRLIMIVDIYLLIFSS